MTKARYDGQSDWYAEITSAPMFTGARARAVELLGHGPGRCLDLGCGTGHAIAELTKAGWSVVATDVSADQLEVARTRAAEAEFVLADAHALPFDDGEFDAVVSMLTHTDLDDVPRAFAEAVRVLRVGGPFVYLGVHPCFASPFAEPRENGTAILHPGYRRAGWQRLPPDPTSASIRSRVGVNHLPLAGLLNSIIRAGLTIEQVEEPGEEDPPVFLAVRATKR